MCGNIAASYNSPVMQINRGHIHGRTETATAIRDSISNSFLVLWILIKIFSGLPVLAQNGWMD